MTTLVIVTSIIALLSLASGNLTTPLIPSIQTPSSGGELTSSTCHLDLSSELFGGVSSACSSYSQNLLDRGRCCPVLAAWLFAAHSRSSLLFSSSPDPRGGGGTDDGLLPLMPDDDSQKCADSLQSSLKARNIELARVNDTCDTVLCFCGIRLHQIGRLSNCPMAFNVITSHENNGTVKPTVAVLDLERDCRNSSFNGCTRCLRSLQKLKEAKPSSKAMTVRGAKMLNRDCQLMGLTWLLAKNKTLYIPTVSAVLRALLYSAHQQQQPPYYYTCSQDRDNMPLAVDSLHLNKLDSSSSSSFALSFSVVYCLLVVGWLLVWGDVM